MPELEKIPGKAEGKPATQRTKRGVGHGDAEVEEVELTPLMNILLVLIPFLASMAIFTHLAVLDFSLPPAMPEGEGAGDESAAQGLEISVVITPNGYTIAGTGQILPQVPKVGGFYDFEALERTLKTIKYKYPQQESVILVVDPNVLYEDIIRFMDKCRESQFPNIGLSGGFQ